MALAWPAGLRSRSARFVLLAFCLQTVVTMAALLFIQRASAHAVMAEQRELVRQLRDELLARYWQAGESGLAAHIRERLGQIRDPNAVIALVRADGARIAGNLAAWPQDLPDSAAWRVVELARTGSVASERMGVSATALPGGSRLLTGRVLETALRLSRIDNEAIVTGLLVSLSLTLACALVLGRILSHQIGQVAATAEAVGRGGLAERVPSDGSGDAFDLLGRTVNGMLDQIQSLIAQLRLMTDGLAHDLKSPVTRLKTALERAKLETQDAVALAALDKVGAEAETLLSMLTTALAISRADAGIGRDAFQTIDLSALLQDLAEVYGPLAEERGFSLTAQAPAGLHAVLHRQLMSQALGNLIENALHYAEAGTRVSLSAETTADGSTIVVADDGPGIPAGDRSRALSRFGRLDPARQKPGSGLGLALAEAVARLHRGSLVLQDNQPGLRVVITLPR